jgi:hypothetical protein
MGIARRSWRASIHEGQIQSGIAHSDDWIGAARRILLMPLLNKRLALVLFLVVTPAAAGSITHEGISFSDESGDFTILKVTGTGSLSDPFVVVENVTGKEPILIIRGLDERFGNRIGSNSPFGMALVKLAVNHSGRPWYGYRIEIRSRPRSPSPDSDGVSFAQGWHGRDTMGSNGFHHFVVTDAPYDALNFSDGWIDENNSVSFSVFITDLRLKPEIYLLQEPETDVACAWPRRGAIC